MASGRNASTQPTYDFLAGSGSPKVKPSPRQIHSRRPASDKFDEELRAEVRALQYELSNIKRERDLVSLQHERELREVRTRAEADFKRAQASEGEGHLAVRKYEAIAKELQELQDASANDKADLERKLRVAHERIQSLEEDVDEAREEISTQERQSSHQLEELERRADKLQHTNDELRHNLEQSAHTVQILQQKSSHKEAEVGDLEGEVLRLKAQAGDADTLNVIKRELSEQVAHIKKLESTNRSQLAELRHFRKLHKSIEVVEEEKKGLENKLRIMDDLRKELSEAQLQKQILENERKSWTIYLQNEGSGTGPVEYDSPEALARALVEERLGRAALMEKMGSLEPELSEKQELISSLEEENGRLKSELEKLKTSGGSNSGVLRRLERQRQLAIKEVEYLRAQLKTFDTEETTFQPENFDEQKTRRIQELEDVVDHYRQELHNMQTELTRLEQSAMPDEKTNTKRPREEEPDERLGLLSRKNRKLQEEISKLHQNIALLNKELEIQKSQVATLQNTSRTRILELRTNPTAEATAIKTSTLSALRTENAALLAQLEGQPHHAKVVPISTLENMRQDLKDMERLVAEKEKRMTRLKEIWSAKSLEFREAVASVLGWKMDFMPNGRVRVTSLYYPGEDDSASASGEGANSIIFDGENGTMKISGGPDGLFAREIRNLIRFWVEERKDIPCFLAAMTLEFYEKTTRAARM